MLRTYSSFPSLLFGDNHATILYTIIRPYFIGHSHNGAFFIRYSAGWIQIPRDRWYSEINLYLSQMNLSIPLTDQLINDAISLLMNDLRNP